MKLVNFRPLPLNRFFFALQLPLLVSQVSEEFSSLLVALIKFGKLVLTIVPPLVVRLVFLEPFQVGNPFFNSCEFRPAASQLGSRFF